MEDLESVASIFVISNVAVSAAYLGYCWYKGGDDYWKIRDIPYEPRRNFFQIQRDQLYRDDHDLEIERVRKYGKIYGYFEQRKPCLIVCDPPVLETVIRSAAFTFRRVFEYPQPVFEYFIPTLNGERWDRVRKTMSHVFTTANIKMMVPIVNGCADTLTGRFDACYEEGIPADCKRLFGDFAMDVLARCAFSIETTAQTCDEDPFVRHARNAFGKHAALKTLGFLILPAYVRYLLGINFLNQKSVDFFKNTIEQELRRREREPPENDFLQVMFEAYTRGLNLRRDQEIRNLETIRSNIENGIAAHAPAAEQQLKELRKYLTHDEVIAQSVMFFVVAYETIISLMCFLAYNLALHPTVQRTLIEEIDGKLNRNGELTLEEVRDDMPYLKQVINETLRFQPPTIKAERTAVFDYKLRAPDLTIEKGTVVGYSIYAIHHDPSYYSDPGTFNPSRFTSDAPSPPPCSFIPFGRGRRNCMGEQFALMEAKHCIIKILSSFRFKTCGATTIPMKYVKNQGLLSPRDCILSVEKRRDAPRQASARMNPQRMEAESASISTDESSRMEAEMPSTSIPQDF